MSGEANLQRSSWKAEAIRRGDLKISGPIPITEDMPLNEEEEQEYAEKQKGELSPLPQDLTVENEPPQQPQAPSHAPPPVPEEHTQTTEQVEERPPTRQEQHEAPQKKSPSPIRVTSETQRRTTMEPISYSTPSPYPNRPDSSAKSTPKKKRKSGLRHVFRKMFGKKHRDEAPDDEPEPVHRGHSHHASDPGLLRQSSDRKQAARMPRISDIPVQEPKPLNPLGQHLPFPMNVNAPQETSPPHEYLTFEAPPPDLGRRRATLPGIFGNPETQSLNGQSKRLEAWEERRDDESIPSPGIGIALSTPYAPHAGHSMSIQSKRRSRSAGALRDLAKGRPSVERRRSAEIRYWRHSHTSASVYSPNVSRPRTAQTVETVRTVEAATKPSESVTDLHPADPIPGQVQQHDQDLSQIQLPVEAFNFGNLRSDFSDDEESEERTASRAHSRDEKRLSIEDRVKHLEEGMRTLETSVHRLSGRSNRQTIILENAPKGRRSSRNRSSSGTSDRQGSHHSSRGSNNTLHHHRTDSEALGRAPDSPLLPPLSAVTEFPSSTSNNRDTVVAIEQHQHARLSTSQSDLAKQVLALTQALTHERSSRKTLEAQIATLQSDLASLHTLVHKLLTTSSPHYPTPSPDAVIASSEERMPTPRASRGKGSGRERFPEHERYREQERYPGLVVGNRYSGSREFDKQGERESERINWSDRDSEASSREDVTSPEAWATPKEESGGFGSGFFVKSRSRENMI
ncbi:hypothetical protein K458DRAFT_402285 [Lentithecium fluviatile CBS 122367]|uniref:Uncharacterized protein n=1 Tax=Lentithecium fluviatile CBS 122367 TaxID=1168545 RepID=A0A6G1J922_9PLEO|nr:hypothetical protein K458DRAFT_402285 [Lentithecium fluviatile CBS 122367]